MSKGVGGFIGAACVVLALFGSGCSGSSDPPGDGVLTKTEVTEALRNVGYSPVDFWRFSEQDIQASRSRDNKLTKSSFGMQGVATNRSSAITVFANLGPGHKPPFGEVTSVTLSPEMAGWVREQDSVLRGTPEEGWTAIICPNAVATGLGVKPATSRRFRAAVARLVDLC